jgi:hypothetical protein
MEDVAHIIDEESPWALLLSRKIQQILVAGDPATISILLTFHQRYQSVECITVFAAVRIFCASGNRVPYFSQLVNTFTHYICIVCRDFKTSDPALCRNRLSGGKRLPIQGDLLTTVGEERKENAGSRRANIRIYIQHFMPAELQAAKILYEKFLIKSI